jgi:hypothetical protein
VLSVLNDMLRVRNIVNILKHKSAHNDAQNPATRYFKEESRAAAQAD